MKYINKILILSLICSILFSSVSYAYPIVNTEDPELTESNYDVIPQLSLEEETVSDNVTHTIHWNEDIKQFDVEIYNRITFRYKDITSFSDSDLGRISTFSDLQKAIEDLPWSYETLDLAKITDDGISSNWGEYSINFSNILQAYINSSSVSVEDARSPFWRIYQYYITQIKPIEVNLGGNKNFSFGFDMDKAVNTFSDYEKNAMYFLQTINYGDVSGCMVQYDRIEYFVRFCRSRSEEFSINDLEPEEDGRYHYTFSGEWAYTSNVPYLLLNGNYDISFSQPVAMFYDGGLDGYTFNHSIKTPLFRFYPEFLYKSSTKKYGDDLVIGDSDLTVKPLSVMDSSNVDFSVNSGSKLCYNNVTIDQIVEQATMNSRYINNYNEPNLTGSYNISYDKFWAYSDGTTSLISNVSDEISFNNRLLSLTDPFDSGFFANSELPCFDNQEDLTDYFNGKTYAKMIQEYTPCYPVLKSWNDDSKTTVNTPDEDTVNYINYHTDITEIADETVSDNDDEYIRLLKKLNNTEKKILSVLKGIGTFDNFYNKIKTLLDNISGTINSIDSSLSNIYNYLKSLVFDTSSDDKPDLTNVETLLTNILNALDIPDYNNVLTNILNAIDIPDYNNILTNILNAIDIPDYSNILTNILNALDFDDVISGLSDIVNEISSAASSIINALDDLEIKIKSVYENDTDNNFLLLYNTLRDDYGADLETKFPFCFIFALVTLSGALIAEPQVPSINIPNSINAFGYDLDLGINQNFDFLNASVPLGSFAITFNDIVGVIRIIILFLFIYNFGLFVFNLIHKSE